MSTLTASHGLTLSKTGLKLIKAYEGFRPVDRVLVSGQRVVGYGHRLYDDKPRQVSKADAEALLISDLRPYEDMINENVYAPLTQGQFDALVSFSFNIGPKAFLASETLHALNNGRPLEAANALDVWRKSTINGKTYIVDALMRRRTAEKALFLRTEHYLRSAPGIDLPPVRDEALAGLTADEDLPVYDRKDSSGIVAAAPFTEEDVKQDDFATEDYALKQSRIALDDSEQSAEEGEGPIQNRRRDDGPAGVLMLSEVLDPPSIQGPAIDDDSVEVPLELTEADLVSLDVADDLIATPPPAVKDGTDDNLKNVTLTEDSVDKAELLSPLTLNGPLNESVRELVNEGENVEATELSANRSVIAEAAADISERLDALIEDAKDKDSDMDWPENSVSKPIEDEVIESSLVETLHTESLDEKADDVLVLSEVERFPEVSDQESNEDTDDMAVSDEPSDTDIIESENMVEAFEESSEEENPFEQDLAEGDFSTPLEEEAPRLSSLPDEKKVDIVIDNLAEDDAMREKDDEMSIFYERHNPTQPTENQSNLGFWMIMLSGFILLGVTLAISLRGAEALMGAWGPLVVIAGGLIGALMVIGAAYYAIRHALSYN